MTGELAGKVALVTGAGQGIGRAVALVLAERGADVVISGRTESKLAAVAEEISSLGARVAVSVGDVGVRADATSMVETAATTFDGLDILVNNAQTTVNGVKVADIDDQTLDTVFGSGARGTLYAMQAALPIMSARGGGCIVNFGSSTAITGDPTFGAYVMTKEAIRGLSRVAAREWGRHNIRVNVVCPAALSDSAKSFRDQHQAAYDAMLKTVPLGRIGDETRDVAGAIASLCGDDWAYLTGATIMLDGGRLLFP
jgi:NAD(P)-dependent dehydrogenase (short-subunit alcohol dehydrogenase family)